MLKERTSKQEDSETPLARAEKKERAETAELLAEYANFDATAKDKKNPLTWALEKGRSEEAKLLMPPKIENYIFDDDELQDLQDPSEIDSEYEVMDGIKRGTGIHDISKDDDMPEDDDMSEEEKRKIAQKFQEYFLVHYSLIDELDESVSTLDDERKVKLARERAKNEILNEQRALYASQKRRRKSRTVKSFCVPGEVKVSNEVVEVVPENHEKKGQLSKKHKNGTNMKR